MNLILVVIYYVIVACILQIINNGFLFNFLNKIIFKKYGKSKAGFTSFKKIAFRFWSC